MPIGETISGALEGLKGNPTMLTLVLINVIYLAAGWHFVNSIGERVEARDKLIAQLATRECK